MRKQTLHHVDLGDGFVVLYVSQSPSNCNTDGLLPVSRTSIKLVLKHPRRHGADVSLGEGVMAAAGDGRTYILRTCARMRSCVESAVERRVKHEKAA